MLQNIMHIFSEIAEGTSEPNEHCAFLSLELDLPVGSELLQMLTLNGFSGERVLMLTLKQNDLI